MFAMFLACMVAFLKFVMTDFVRNSIAHGQVISYIQFDADLNAMNLT
jgi:hypothetical protein